MMWNKPTIDSYYRAITEKGKDDIKSQPDDYIVSVQLEEYVDYLFEKYALLPVELDEDRGMTIEQKRESKQIHDRFFDRTVEREMEVAQIEYPLKPHGKIKEVLDLFPSTQTTMLPTYEYRARDTTIVLKAQASQQEVEHEVKLLQNWLTWRNNDINKLNPQFRGMLTQTVQQRKEFIRESHSDFDELVQKINIPLRRKTKSETGVVDLSVRRKIEVLRKPPEAKRPEEYIIRKDTVLDVVGLIDSAGRQFEITPSSYAKLSEENLRDILLGYLNIVFESAATGETFSKRGKTDIYLVIPKGGILIGECKYWDGGKLYEDTIDQLFRYLTWRQNYGIIITFSRNVSFSNVLNEAEKAIIAHPTYNDGFRQVTKSHFQSQNLHPDDPKIRMVEIHHLFYNLFAG